MKVVQPCGTVLVLILSPSKPLYMYFILHLMMKIQTQVTPTLDIPKLEKDRVFTLFVLYMFHAHNYNNDSQVHTYNMYSHSYYAIKHAHAYIYI